MTDKQKIKELQDKIKEQDRALKLQANINKCLVAAVIHIGKIIKNGKKK